MDGDSSEPRREARATLERSEMLVRAYERILRDVLGCVFVADDRACGAKNATLVAANEQP